MTLAPREAATSAVRSVEPLSTTIISSTNSGMARKTFAIPASSFRQGMMTVIDWPLYMRLCGRLFGGRRRHNGTGDEIDQTYSFPPVDLRRRFERRRFGQCARCVPA